MPPGFAEVYYQTTVVPSMWEQDVRMLDLPAAANQVIPEWGIVAQTTGANTDDVQTYTNTGTSGTFTVTVGNALTKTTTALNAASCTAAQLQAALNAAYAALCPGGPATGYVTVTGGPFTSGGGTLTVTYNNGTGNTGPLSSNPQTLATINNNNVGGGSVTVAHTTTGIQQGGLVNYVGTLVANPTTAPTLSDNATAGTWSTASSSTWEVCYTWVTAGGESIPSYAATIALATASHSIGIASITGIPTGVLSVNVYVNGLFAKNVAVTAGATGAIVVTGPTAATAATPPPKVTSAFLNGDGSQIPVGIAWYAMASGPNSQITYGNTSPTGNSWSYPGYTGNVAVRGWFSANSINAASALDQNTITTLGRLVNGSLSNLTNATLAIYGG